MTCHPEQTTRFGRLKSNEQRYCFGSIHNPNPCHPEAALAAEGPRGCIPRHAVSGNSPHVLSLHPLFIRSAARTIRRGGELEQVDLSRRAVDLWQIWFWPHYAVMRVSV